MDSITKYVNHFQDRRPQTLENAEKMLRTLDQYYQGEQITDLSDDEILDYLKRFTNANTWNVNFCVIRQFYRWWFRDEHYLEDLHAKRPTSRITSMQITEQHVQWIIQSCQSVRDKALMAVMWVYGFRRGELISVRVGDVKYVDGKGVYLHCPEGKTGPRTVPGIDPTALLMAWLEQHPRKGNPEAPLFCTIHGKVIGAPLRPFTINNIFFQAEKRARILHPDLPHFHPHMARHYAATQAAKMPGMNEEKLMKRFGWVTNTMPHIYCHVTEEDADNAYWAAYGLDTSKPIAVSITNCPRCKTPNESGSQYCPRCGSPMTLAVIEQVEEKREEGLLALARAIAEHPELVELVQSLKAKPASSQPGLPTP